MTQQVMALCGAMGADADREELMLPLVQAVCDQLAARLKAGTAPEACGPAFPMAAAMIVMDRLAGVTGEGGIASFTAGDLTIRKETGSGQAGLSEQAEKLLLPWLGDAGFCFQGVKG